MIEIKNYPNYSIDINGNVFNTKRKKQIKIQTDKDGYNYIQVWKCSKPKKLKIHRLIAEYFIGNPENKPQVNHKNGIKNDNRIENLEWATSSENITHAYKNELMTFNDKRKESFRLSKAKLVLNTQNGIFYDCMADAAKSYGKYSAYNISEKINGRLKNNTPFVLA